MHISMDMTTIRDHFGTEQSRAVAREKLSPPAARVLAREPSDVPCTTLCSYARQMNLCVPSMLSACTTGAKSSGTAR